MERVRAVLAESPVQGAFREITDARQADRALQELQPGPEDVLCVAGGDGTVQAVLTALLAVRADGDWPTLLTLPAGSTNMTANDHWGVRSLHDATDAFCVWARAGGGGGRRVRRPVVRVERPGKRPLAGFFFGVGAVTNGVRFFERRLKGVAKPTERTAFLSILRILTGLVFRDPERVGALRISTRWDDAGEDDAVAVLHLATTLERLILGARPFWGDEPRPLHFTRVRADARRLFLNLPRLARGRPGAVLSEDRGYLSHNVDRLELHFDGSFILDGELYDVRRAEGPIVVTAPHSVEWIVPR